MKRRTLLARILAAVAVTPFLGAVAATPARATGGPISVGNAYMVGERGCELWTPDQHIVISAHALNLGKDTAFMAADAARGIEELRDAGLSIEETTQLVRRELIEMSRRDLGALFS